MRKILSATVCVSALLLAGAATPIVVAPAAAQDDYDSVSFDSFHDALAPYGDWVYSDRWGEVWIPADVPYDFQPYGTNGRWVYTDDYGWTWDSGYPWGDVVFHYGRWVNDPDDGWLWIPGYVWSPGWVIWRSNDEYTGWMPMPPDDSFLRGTDVGFGVGGLSLFFSFGNEDDYYGYSRWYRHRYDDDRFARNWVFMDTGHMGDRDYRRWRVPRGRYVDLLHNTRNVTNYRIHNNYIVNRSIDPRLVERRGGRAVKPVRLSDVMHAPNLVTHADRGSEIQRRIRKDIPHGTGFAGTAPTPPQAVINSLSTKPRGQARKFQNLYTRETIGTAPLVGRGVQQGGKPPTTNMQGTVPGTQFTPNTGQGGAMGGPPGTSAAPGANVDKAKLNEYLRQRGMMPAPDMQGAAPKGTPSTNAPPTGAGGPAIPALTPEQQRKLRERMKGGAMEGAPTGPGPGENPTGGFMRHNRATTGGGVTGPTFTPPAGTSGRPAHNEVEHAPPPTGPSFVPPSTTSGPPAQRGVRHAPPETVPNSNADAAAAAAERARLQRLQDRKDKNKGDNKNQPH